jgi:hypothetical protein
MGESYEKRCRASLNWREIPGRSVKGDGSFVNNYDQILDRESRDYKLVRHAEVLRHAGDLPQEPGFRLLGAAERAIGNLLRQVKDGTFEDRQ